MRKRIIKIAFISFITALGIFFLWTGFLWKFFSGGWAGSYPYVETWKFNVPESYLIQKISEVKHEHPELQAPSPFDSSERYEYWYYIDFYYPDTKEIVRTFIQSTYGDSSHSTLSLIELAPPVKLKLGDTDNGKLINRDFGYFENRSQIKKFEREIIDRINEKLGNN